MDWVVNDVIVLAPTSYNTWEAEKLTITAVSADKMTVTFTPALQYKHIGNILKLFSILLLLFKKIISNFKKKNIEFYKVIPIIKVMLFSVSHFEGN